MGSGCSFGNSRFFFFFPSYFLSRDSFSPSSLYVPLSARLPGALARSLLPCASLSGAVPVTPQPPAIASPRQASLVPPRGKWSLPADLPAALPQPAIPSVFPPLYSQLPQLLLVSNYNFYYFWLTVHPLMAPILIFFKIRKLGFLRNIFTCLFALRILVRNRKP